MPLDLLALSKRVGAALTASGRTICAAESCTGGLLLSALTDMAGSSAYVLGGFVTYSNAAKMQLLGVREATLLEHGAVSRHIAAEMARGAQEIFVSDFALSVTGIAGPGGATADKPVGLTYIGLAGRGGLLKVERRIWSGDRIENKQLSVAAALNLLLRELAG
ncbi:MAG: CinA family protein [Chloroflexi bacterium]|nr:CinA family protein [Chloroflexota bacterium]MCY3580976.1 CinA family protein [Chloroflexota bacterium]MCY3717652.1 CinA family protein [Chloroflexota bacterium]MDE2650523.1 CinA family protein [Chloroflexota bacterium]MXV91984.1 CinA family protein [Chloroflexota bacterium]